MLYTLRPIRLPEDYAGIARVLNANQPEPISAEKLADDDNHMPKQNIPRVNEEGRLTGFYRERVVAVDDHGAIVGYLVGWRAPWTQPGYINSTLVVDPAYWGQGIGSALADHLVNWARQLGASLVQSEMRDNVPGGRAFAEKRGFAIDRHGFESTLDLAAFDPAPFAGVVESVQASGIRFSTLAAEPDAEAEQALYTLFYETRDVPWLEDDAVLPFNAWRKWILELSNPEDVLLAYDGARLVGTSILVRNKETRALYNEYTGVLRAYRGRKIALTLKLLTIRIGQESGAPYIRTDNDSANEPMLGINRRLGYVPAPGLYRIRKPLS